jgi:hypothetical protein
VSVDRDQHEHPHEDRIPVQHPLGIGGAEVGEEGNAKKPLWSMGTPLTTLPRAAPRKMGIKTLASGCTEPTVASESRG